MIHKKIQKVALIFIFLFPALSLFSESERDPFTVAVEIEEGENVIGWEAAIFGKEQKGTKKEFRNEPNDSDTSVIEEKKPEQESLNYNKKTNEKTATLSEDISQKTTAKETEKKPDESAEFGNNDPKWGRYYGKDPEVSVQTEYTKIEKAESIQLSETIDEKLEKPFLFPVDLLLWSQGGDGYNPMINTGVRVSFMNMYSVISVGTDFSADLYRPLSLGLSAGGFYRLSDFSISADLGYEIIWDFSGNRSVNDYALGLKAGLSYNIWSWFAVSAGAGVNYSVFKDSNFENGRFIPMIFGGFEFNLIK